MPSNAMVKPARRARRKPANAGGLRVLPTVRGHGAYSYAKPGPWGYYGRALAGAAGGAAGGLAGGSIGGPIGRAVGSVAGKAIGGKVGSYLHYIGKIFGSGDYVTSADSVRRNVLVNSSQIPSFSGNKNEVHIRHREFICNIVSSATANTFNIQTFNINPGLLATFPWLAGVVGDNFQQYRVNGMVFEYRSLSADAIASSTNTTLGSVIMATDYDSKDAAFTSKAQMENTEYGVSCKPSCSMIHAIECARTQTSVSELYVRAGAVPSGADIRLYDLGAFSIATDGFQGTSVVAGELWVSYDISALKAYQGIPGAIIPSAHYRLDPANMATKPFVALTTATQFDTIGLTFSANGLTVSFPYTIPVGSMWLMQLALDGTATASLNSLDFSTTAGGLSGWGSNFVTPKPNGTLTANRQTDAYIFQYTGGATPAVPPSFTVTIPGVMMSAYSAGQLWVSQINGNWPA